MKKMPPIEKIYEAYSALADNRIYVEDNAALLEVYEQKNYQKKKFRK